jgi:phage shock protein PspC (stress-responsive transcriptional regulator)
MDSAQQLPKFKRFQRSRNNVVLAGVCSGIADYFNADVGNLRLIALFTLLLGGWSIIAYLITASLMSIETSPPVLSDKQLTAQRKENFRVVLSGILLLVGFHYALIAFGLSSSVRIFLLPNSFLFPVAVFFLGVIILINKNYGASENPKNRAEKLFRSKNDRRLMGVCGGLGKYLDIDSSSLRIIFILMTLLTLGAFSLLYILIVLLTSSEAGNNLE